MAGNARTRDGITFVEILLAVFILAAVVVPIAMLISGGLGASDESKNYGTGINVACDIMAKILAPELPYWGIDPEGGPSVSLSYGGTRKQATFTTEHADYERVLSDDGDASRRIIKRHNIEYETFFFAGRYRDTNPTKPPRTPDPRKELTFSYFKGPWLDLTTDEQQLCFLPAGKTPYKSQGQVNTEDPAQNTPRDPRCRAAWPWATDSGPKLVTPKKLLDISDAVPNVQAPLVVLDLDEMQEGEEGSLLKVVVGVRWNPAGNIFKGPGYFKNSREFWLVSVKAKLEDRK